MYTPPVKRNALKDEAKCKKTSINASGLFILIKATKNYFYWVHIYENDSVTTQEFLKHV